MKIPHIYYAVDLYCINREEMSRHGDKIPLGFTFKLIRDVSEMHLLGLAMSERGKKYENAIEERLASGNFLCFCFLDSNSGLAVYSRWLRRGFFYHDRFKETIPLADDEAFTMDSYTARKFRGKGLHKEMNKCMLNYCMNEMQLNKVYMVIVRGKQYAHLHKLVREIGYQRVRSRWCINTRWFKLILQRIMKNA